MDQYVALALCEETGSLAAAHVVVGVDAAHTSVLPLYGNDGESQ